MVIGIVSIFAGLMQLVFSVVQFSKIRSKGFVSKGLLSVIFCIIFSLINLTYPLDLSIIGLSLGLVIASLFFYLIFDPILAIGNAQFRVGILVSGMLITAFLYIVLTFAIRIHSIDGIILIPIIMSFYYIFGTVISLHSSLQRNVSYKAIFINGAASIIFMIAIALAITLENANISFITSLNIFFVIFFYQSLAKSNALLFSQKAESQVSDFGDFNLTKMELMVANYLIQGKSPQEISDLLGCSKDVVYKHASNCYKKTNTVDRTTFVIRFGE